MVDLMKSAKCLSSLEESKLQKLGSLLTENKHAQSDEYLIKKDQEFDRYFKLIENRSTKISQEIKDYWEMLKDIPTAVMLVFCIEKSQVEGVAANFDRFTYILGIQRLWETGLLATDNQGNRQILADLDLNKHLQMIETIRCVRQWSVSEQEGLIACYLQFTYDLARFTFGMVPVAFDPDRLRVERKMVRYELFIEFVQLLSERDALIAKLLYFGAPSVEAVTSLKIAAIHTEKPEITFGERVVSFPRHLMQDVFAHIQTRKDNPDGLVFVNLRGEPVERVHLYQSFMRKSSASAGEFKITPASLLKTI